MTRIPDGLQNNNDRLDISPKKKLSEINRGVSKLQYKRYNELSDVLEKEGFVFDATRYVHDEQSIKKLSEYKKAIIEIKNAENENKIDKKAKKILSKIDYELTDQIEIPKNAKSKSISFDSVRNIFKHLGSIFQNTSHRENAATKLQNERQLEIDKSYINGILSNKEELMGEDKQFQKEKIYNFLSGIITIGKENNDLSVKESNFDEYFNKLANLGKKYQLNVIAQGTGGNIPVNQKNPEPWKLPENINDRLSSMGLQDSHREIVIEFYNKNKDEMTDEYFQEFKSNSSKIATKILESRFNEIDAKPDLTLDQKKAAKLAERTEVDKPFTQFNNLCRKVIDSKSLPEGFLRFRPNPPLDATPKERVYISMNPEKAEALMDLILGEVFGDNAEDFPGVCEVKIVGPKQAGRSDGIVIYIADSENQKAEDIRNKIVQFIQSNKDSQPDLFTEANYPFKIQHAPGLASAICVGDKSYTEIAAELIAQELNALQDENAEPEMIVNNVNNRIREMYLNSEAMTNGISEATPAERPFTCTTILNQLWTSTTEGARAAFLRVFIH